MSRVLTRMVFSNKEWAAKNKAKGLCACGKPPIEGKKYCQRCKSATQAWAREVRAQVIEAYGGKCQCPSGKCTESNPYFLTIDHIFNDGKHHRRVISNGNPRVSCSYTYRWLQKHGFPKDRFRLLCWNCNCGRAKNKGICPHEFASRIDEL